MTRYRSNHNRRRLVTRLLLAGTMVVAMLAGAFAATPASAGSLDDNSVSPNRLTPVIENTTCSAFQSGFGAATGSCQNPSFSVTFRVRATCRNTSSGVNYQVFSPIVSSFDTTHAFCETLRPDPILQWSTQLFLPPPPPPPTISSLNCQVSSFTQMSCNVSASGWTELRWFVDGSLRPEWNNQTSVQGGCPGFNSDPNIEIEFRDVLVRVNATNASGTTHSTTLAKNCLVIGS